MSKSGRVVLSSLIWTFAGALFGGLFSGLLAGLTGSEGIGWITVLLAVMLAAVITASFFGSMQVSLLGCMVGVLVSLGYIMVGAQGGLPLLVLITAAFALVSGGILPATTIIRTRPLAQAASGLLSGLLAGVLLVGAVALLPIERGSWLMAMVAVGFVGIFYVVIAPFLVGRCSNRVSVRLGAPLVSMVVGSAVAVGNWVFLTVANGSPGDPMLSEFELMVASIRPGMIGGAVGGAIGGGMMELLGIRIGDYAV